MDSKFHEKFFILALDNGTIRSEYGLPHHELHKERHYVTRDHPIFLHPNAKAFIFALNTSCRRRGDKLKSPSMTKVVTSIDALVTSDLFIYETRRIGKPNFPTYP